MDKLNRMYEKMTVSDDVVARAVNQAKQPPKRRFPWQAAAGIAAAAVLVIAVGAFLVPMAFGSLLRASSAPDAAYRSAQTAQEENGVEAFSDAAPDPDVDVDNASGSASAGSYSTSPEAMWDSVERYALPVEHIAGEAVYGGETGFAADKAYYDGEVLYIRYSGHMDIVPDGIVGFVYACWDDALSAVAVNGVPTAPLTEEFVLHISDGEVFGVLELYWPSDESALEITTDFAAFDALYSDGSAAANAIDYPLTERYRVTRSEQTE